MCCNDMIMNMNVNFNEVIEQLVATFNYTMTSIDPEVKEWPMMSSPMPTLYISLVYLAIVTILTYLMKRIDEFNFKFLIFCYNVFMIFLNIYISGQIIFLKYETNDLELCTKIHSSNTSYSGKMNRVIWWFYISKGIELLDTIFFLLRKKFYKLSFLHIYNHATMFMIWWFLVSGNLWLPSGYTAIVALINSSLHVLMYFYYAVSAIGPSFQRFIWWKKYLTFFQTFQFAFLIVYCSLLLYEACEPPVNDRMLWLVIYYSLSHVVLIYDFYTNSYYKIMYNRIDNSNKSNIENDSFFKIQQQYPDEFNITKTITKRRPLHID